MVSYAVSTEERLAGNVYADLDTGCWLWAGYTDKDGYGKLYVPGEGQKSAHREAYERFIGPIPDGLEVLHQCDRPSCINWVSHLFVGTQRDNMQDAIAKGRFVSGERNGMAKLTDAQIAEIRRTYRPGYRSEFSSGGLARKYGVTDTCILRIVGGKSRGTAAAVTVGMRKSGLSDEQVAEMRALYQRGVRGSGTSIRALAERYATSFGVVQRLVSAGEARGGRQSEQGHPGRSPLEGKQRLAAQTAGQTRQESLGGVPWES